MAAPHGADSKLFTPLKIGNGKINLKHRVVFAPLTRNRGVPLYEQKPGKVTNTWVHDEVGVKYYEQRASEGGLLITEGIPPTLESNGSPCVPGLWLVEQAEAWKMVTSAVHAKGGYIYAQLWHAGRSAYSPFTGAPSVSSCSVPMEGEYRMAPPGYKGPMKYSDIPPTALTVDGIKRTIGDIVVSATLAIETAGFDGVEVHGANGYLVEQFLNDNINTRTDEYGGSPEKRCKFVVELMEELAQAVGEENVAIRLSPMGLFNGMRGSQRLETWSHLCKQLKAKIPGMSYMHFIEPRFEQILEPEIKKQFLDDWGLGDLDLGPFRKIMGNTPLFSAGGYSEKSAWGVLETGLCDALVFGRYYISNPDLPRRLREGKPLHEYDRARFYLQPPGERAKGYTDYPFWEDEEPEKKSHPAANEEKN